MTKPWIAIPTRYHDKTGYFGQLRHYLDAVIWAGGLPLLIPCHEEEVIYEYVHRAQGVLLPGSASDIDPAHYGAPRHPNLGKLNPDRDRTDFAILNHVEESGKPLPGISQKIRR